MMNQIKKFVKEEKGQGMTEYGLILGVIAVGAVVAITAFGDAIVDKLEEVKTNIFGGSTTTGSNS
ncbi:Flp family type IVb pilin [Neobacillus muris]|uniref:Flp family type IVb pilin n=1 Tax=Neobacillus muris TaxID=2941334 RepID=UPI00203FCA0F|nr:Flp family type IVb pilin [Neobacillus muris]